MQPTIIVLDSMNRLNNAVKTEHAKVPGQHTTLAYPYKF